ncbi:zinc-dependent alcohol dehydrogenase [Pseudogracilibacillus auburnensis]|uniref:zinc-dependent alcohol dehydrogenase n=1 Tax=Pseudogracilibacillus auburnensis TaxID=1494959 RepID=UPI001A977DA4|nr:alcohol dehydrogenase catalytic domain-containing protein [Pseudogracilibacillus auburnensis]MBO1001944.1 alcohol dehydrogenase catalytic domain-containing protein [Pseudogracilibacillus auburnensis]
MGKLMKAVQFMNAYDLKYNNIAIPTFQEDEVLIKVHQVGICATDLEIFEGNMVYFQTGQSTFPIIPGHEWSGEIVAIGEAVTDFSVGDRVVGETTLPCGKCARCLQGRYNLCPHRIECGVLAKNGACAEYITYPTHVLHRFSSHVSYEEASLIEPAAVAYRATGKLNIKPNDHVAVMGGGPIGLLAVQMAKVFGANKVTLIDMNETRLQVGKELGADYVINAARGDLLDQVKQVTNNQLFSAMVEATGNTIAIENSLDTLIPGGRLCLIGLCGGKKATINTDLVVANDLELHGSLGSPNVWNTVISLLEDGKINTRRLITHRFALGQFGEALHFMGEKDPSCIKIIVDVG